MNDSETIGFKVRAYENIGERPSAGVPPKDTLRTKIIEAKLMQDGKPSVNVSDFDPDGRTFLARLRWEELGFFMGITSLGQEFTAEAAHKGYDSEEVLRDIAPELGRFSVLTVAQPAYSLVPSVEDKLKISPAALEHFQSMRVPYLFVALNSKGQTRAYIEDFANDRYPQDHSLKFDIRERDWGESIFGCTKLPQSNLSRFDHEILREVHDSLEQQAIDHVVEAAKWQPSPA